MLKNTALTIAITLVVFSGIYVTTASNKQTAGSPTVQDTPTPTPTLTPTPTATPTPSPLPVPDEPLPTPTMTPKGR